MKKCPVKKIKKLPKHLRKALIGGLGINLDVGCGFHKQPNFIGLDKRKIPGIVDIVHDAEVFPWPLPDDICNKILLSHLWEHIKPWLTIDLMDECWRIMKPHGQLLLSTPYAGSFGYYQDPTHCNPANEATWTYFDPQYPLYGIYKPKPWKVERNAYQMNSNMEVILAKRTVEEGKKAESDRLALSNPAANKGVPKPKKDKD